MNKIEMKRMPLGIFVRMHVARFVERLRLIRSDMDRNVPHAYESRKTNEILLSLGAGHTAWRRLHDWELITAVVVPDRQLRAPRYGRCVDIVSGRIVVEARARYWADINPGLVIYRVTLLPRE